MEHLSCEGCQSFGIKDEGFEQNEWHDDYCFHFGEWNPRRCGLYEPCLSLRELRRTDETNLTRALR